MCIRDRFYKCLYCRMILILIQCSPIVSNRHHPFLIYFISLAFQISVIKSDIIYGRITKPWNKWYCLLITCLLYTSLSVKDTAKNPNFEGTNAFKFDIEQAELAENGIFTLWKDGKVVEMCIRDSSIYWWIVSTGAIFQRFLLFSLTSYRPASFCYIS